MCALLYSALYDGDFAHLIVLIDLSTEHLSQAILWFQKLVQNSSLPLP